ncbi:MAG: hypothetical protein IKI49_04215 [Oscillospiraceae bacterium]|nr:hypothetical protein [Oscillospiraceae bacterium]
MNCPNCGSPNISFIREKQGELKAKKGTAIVRSTIGVCKACGYTCTATSKSQKKPKSKIWLWVLGWILIFPVPLTILMLRKKDMKPALKYGIIAVAWIVFLAIGFFGKTINKTEHPTEVAAKTDQSVVETSNNSNTGNMDDIS